MTISGAVMGGDRTTGRAIGIVIKIAIDMMIGGAVGEAVVAMQMGVDEQSELERCSGVEKLCFTSQRSHAVSSHLLSVKSSHASHATALSLHLTGSE